MAKKSTSRVASGNADGVNTDSGESVIDSGVANEPIGTVIGDDGGDSEPEIINGYESVNPANIDGAGNNGNDYTVHRKRGRKPGSKNTQKEKSNSLAGLENILFTLHLFAGKIVAPQLALSPEECKQLAEATKRVAEFYPIGMTDKTMAWVNLAMVGGAIYGMRAVAIWNSKPQKPAQPTPIRPGPVPAPAPMQPAAQVKVPPMPSFEGKAPSDLYGQFAMPIG